MTGELNESNDADGAARSRPRVDRRTMIKSAAAVGAGALAWSAPRIETLGFAPAAARTKCVLQSVPRDDKNSQLGQNDCPTDPLPPPAGACCGQSFGNSGQVDDFTFVNPAPNCQRIVLRTITRDCDPAKINPDIGQFAVVIESFSESVPGACSACTVFDVILIASNARNVPLRIKKTPFSCPGAGLLGDGVLASFACDDPLITESARLAVRISCDIVGACPVVAP